MARPSTQGCTELSCVYHGQENREKLLHAPGCPTRERDDAFPIEAPITTGCVCTCGRSK